MDTPVEEVPAVDGWFTMDADKPALLGSLCPKCDTYSFPRETRLCKNPGCSETELEEVALSTVGKLWSYTNNCYPPPPPYKAADPFVPFAIAAVELEKEKLVILGQVVEGITIEDLHAGMTMHLTLAPLFEENTKRHMVWKWDPQIQGANT